MPRSRRPAQPAAASIRMTNNPDGPPLDVERILATLNRHQVDYLVVGGGAANAYSAAVTIRFANSEVRVAALEDIIASKEWADRPKDLDALPELHAINSRRGNDPAEPAPF